ncbi:hypothetical protein EC845_2221 [Comamonas sp. BIGb0124]|uniref:hypothetical protein n=1 Tax=Comamonas sp. BIGb0124 TaxID=2485130 RepID=UPI000F4A9377|nr:hypothetical protein [Comamonas sp. BIGb0124]ROR21405.1 hypothetical protein EC845_2221 [Comamonas sp. BIGb0124]
MAKLFDTYERIVPTWLAAAQHLNAQRGRNAQNLLLEIKRPLDLTDEDREIMVRVDVALARKGLTLRTVAGTIFPIAMYQKYGRPGYYAQYTEMLKRGQKKNTWGTYAHRMIERPGKDVGTTINPLDFLVEKLKAEGQPQRKDGVKVSFASTYELSVADPEEDLLPQADAGGDVPTYDPALDMREWLGLPCLSHLSFKRMPSGTNKGHAVDLTAVYRAHHYCARALGNLIGLGQLLSFVAKESGLEVGKLSCLSTHAELDVKEWGGVGPTNAILNV